MGAGGDGVDLVAGPSTTLSRGPGGSFALPLRVDVAGATAVDEPRVYFTDVVPGVPGATRKFNRCLYVLDRIRSCAFAGTFTPGATYTAVLPFLVGADTAALSTRDLHATWFTAAEAEHYDVAGHRRLLARAAPMRLPLTRRAGVARRRHKATVPSRTAASCRSR